MKKSLRSSERGLKSFSSIQLVNVGIVAPFVGAWIEIAATIIFCAGDVVAPFVGAWIEILKSRH